MGSFHSCEISTVWKSIETETRLEVTRGQEEEEREIIAQRIRVSLQLNETVLETGSVMVAEHCKWK